VRVVCATHQDLQGLIKQQRFREDLYYRWPRSWSTFRRCGNGRAMLLLAQAFLRRFAQEQRRSLSFADEAMTAIERHDWPGNVRQLLNAMKRAAIMADGLG
jgi:two-component system NtrC family response regulator